MCSTLQLRWRDFFGAGAWPLTAHAQQPKMPVIGFVHGASPSYFARWARAVRDGLKEAGYVEGRNVAAEYRWPDGHYDHLPALVADLGERPVTVIFAGRQHRSCGQVPIRRSAGCGGAPGRAVHHSLRQHGRRHGRVLRGPCQGLADEVIE